MKRHPASRGALRAAEGNRTPITSLGSSDNNHYMTAAFFSRIYLKKNVLHRGCFEDCLPDSVSFSHKNFFALTRYEGKIFEEKFTKGEE